MGIYFVELNDESYGESYYVLVKAETLIEAKANAVLKYDYFSKKEPRCDAPGKIEFGDDGISQVLVSPW